jgi:hypothetical protein
VPISVPSQTGSKLIQRLFDFGRVSDVAVGASARWELKLGAEVLALTDVATGDIVSAPGQYEVWLRRGDGTGPQGGGDGDAKVELVIEGTERVIEPFPRS